MHGSIRRLAVLVWLGAGLVCPAPVGAQTGIMADLDARRAVPAV